MQQGDGRTSRGAPDRITDLVSPKPKPKAKAKPKARKPKAKPKPKRAPKSLQQRGARVVSVFGPFNCRTLVELPTTVAEELFPDGLGDAARAEIITSALAGIERIRQRSAETADSTLAALSLELAYVIANPYNSATSKAANAAQLRECLVQLEAMLPPKRTEDAIDDIARKREERQAAAARASAATT